MKLKLKFRQKKFFLIKKKNCSICYLLVGRGEGGVISLDYLKKKNITRYFLREDCLDRDVKSLEDV